MNPATLKIASKQDAPYLLSILFYTRTYGLSLYDFVGD